MAKPSVTTLSRDPRIVIICAVLFAAVWIVFGRSLTHAFVNFDDEVYVYQNPEVSAGLTVRGLIGAFAHSHARNWHPLTTVSHLLDCQWFGLNAGGHHFTNVLLHSISAVLLLLVLRKFTGALWPSAMVAAVFALHPLRVESVAWVAERKDVLSGLFFMLTLGAYVRYVRAPAEAKGYAMLIVCFAAGLLCKPMLVTVPAVLLLLDFWPLGRFERAPGKARRNRQAAPQASWLSLVREKIPLLLLSALSCVATLLAQRDSVGAMEALPLSWRIENALVTFVVYLVQIIWPFGLAPFYPHPAGTLPMINVVASLAVIGLLTTFAIHYRNTKPWLLVGWLWYLIMLLPVIGIVQVGLQGHADRYTYLPHIGIYLAVVWSLAEFLRGRRVPRTVVMAAATAFLLTMSYLSWVQTGYWRDSRTLWNHTAAVTSDNEVAENNLGILLEHEGRADEAISHYEKAVAIQTGRGQARYRLTLALSENNLGNAFARKGEPDQAVSHYRRAVALRPDYADGWYNLGVLLSQNRDVDGAIECFKKALAVRANDASAHGHLGDALRRKHADAEAQRHYEKALELEPRAVWAVHSLAWLLATSPDAQVRDGSRAQELARNALTLPRGENAAIFRVLAAAYGAQGKFGDAIGAAEHGLQLAASRDEVASLRADLELYRQNVPVREIAPSR